MSTPKREKMSNPVLKSLIESMIVNHLEESYEDDLMESIFEEVSSETWEAIEEAILNELSPKTLASYMKKSDKSLDKLGSQRHKVTTAYGAAYKTANKANDSLSDLTKQHSQLTKKINNRMAGQDRAYDKLSK